MISGTLATSGAGGSVYINATNLIYTGSPVISADAGLRIGDSRMGGSAGGLVKIALPTSQTGSCTPTATEGITAGGGGSGTSGGAGTVTTN